MSAHTNRRDFRPENFVSPKQKLPTNTLLSCPTLTVVQEISPVLQSFGLILPGILTILGSSGREWLAVIVTYAYNLFAFSRCVLHPM